MGRILAIDHGTVRIGVAISDALGLVASPLTTLAAAAEPLREIEKMVATRDIERVIVGLPLRMDGARGSAVIRVEKFIEALEKTLGPQVPVEAVDERLSSVEAEASLNRSGITDPHARRQVVDQLAAVVFLQDYLNAQRGPEGFLLPDESFDLNWGDDSERSSTRKRRP